MITLITTTGGRARQFSLCEKYMARQSVSWDQWIVVDDCRPRTKVTLGQEYLNPPWVWKSGMQTQVRGIEFAMKKIKGDRVFFIDDDDWYSEDYLKVMLENWKDEEDLVGEGNSLYYHVPTGKYAYAGNRFSHASLNETGITRDALFSSNIEGCKPPYFDSYLWAHFQAFKKNLFLQSPPICVCMKGMKGKPGVVPWHEDPIDSIDSNGLVETILGEDFQHYVGDV